MNSTTALQMRICHSQEMRDLDHRSEREFGIHSEILMENAGKAASQVLLEYFPDAGKTTEILVFAGKGNNAGDALVLARHLLCLDRKVRVFHLAQGNEYKGPSLKNFDILKKLKAKMSYVERSADLQDFFTSSNGPYVAVDGILGTGLKGNLEGKFYEAVEMINQYVADVLSLDIPTGINADTGEVHGASVFARVTVSFGFPKLGHFLPPGAIRRGELVNVDISLPPQFRKEGDKFLLMKDPLSHFLQERDRYGHKNSFGHTLLIGGSPGRLGAIVMAARACHKMGTGLVTVATWTECLDALVTKLPDETMAVPLHLSGSEFEFYKESLNSYSSIVVGPGLGLRPEGKQLLQQLLEIYRGPMVIDADALNLVADHQLFDHMMRRAAPTVLTPHPGEMARLLRISKNEILADPIRSIRECVKKTHAAVLLKGAATLMSSPEDVLYLNHYPNDGMATAGSGDVLAGMIGGLVGQKIAPFEATQLGVYLHSLAGDFAARAFGHRSMTAPDIIENIGNAFKEIKNAKKSTSMDDGRTKLR